jgi:hypothetical protein
MVSEVADLIQRDVYAPRSWSVPCVNCYQRVNEPRDNGNPNGRYAADNSGVWIKASPGGTITVYDRVWIRRNGTIWARNSLFWRKVAPYPKPQ